MIVWSGKGLIVPLVAFVVAGIGGMLGEMAGKQASLLGDLGFSYGLALGLLLSGLVLKLLWPKLRGEARVLVDPKTNQRIQFEDRSSLFFVPVPIWSYILMSIGAAFLVALLSGWKPEPSKKRMPRQAPGSSVPAPSGAPVAPGRTL